MAVAGGAIPGHVSVMRVPDEPLVTSAGDEAAIWSAGTGLPPHRLASVNALFVDPTAAGQGVGAALHDVAVAAIREEGLVPVLDVVSRNTAAVRLYERRGWRLIGTGRPDWLPDEWDPVWYMTLD